MHKPAVFLNRATPPKIVTLTLLAGAVFGLGQQMRGAHFLSHVLWTLWLSWAIVLAVHAGVRAWRTPSELIRKAAA